ncbi:hypothetical protein CONPUDRAFT_79587 [Coniophora puteana RWD-64-598 SS2]|uniref:Asl1-like glycosyl hydrolase catalytic domain-containing protein n=1 Tax=Coniophora puteana (strain RWD-64-598) TaxID=741705 RepID=A0A5M3N0B5_CONPW|nr:uncharacterized protein CONPUDRAFT_79587 [Coniophora puteana RWD-64-598 SS2]EIW84822.1 hypothetical protein CONPUDRAFT_79587 [Coniophora puteana RWD-64-598 SS2]
MLSTAFAALALFTAAAQAGKRGLTWTYYDSTLDTNVLNNGDGNIVAIYDYETYAPPCSNGIGNLGFIGMQRCTDCDSSPIAQLASRQSAQGWATLFTLNEPDTGMISPGDAATWYINNINAIPIKKALPAVTSSASAGQGLDWLSQMISACNGGCSYDYINLHWYGPDFATFQSYVESANSKFPNTQIVITEFALQNPAGGQADQVNFFKQAIPFLDGADYVQLYFPFVASSPSLFQQNDAAGAGYAGTGSCLYNDDGSASAVGQLFM